MRIFQGCFCPKQMGGVRKAFQEVGPAGMNKCLRTQEYSVLQIVGVVGIEINSGRGEVCLARP